MMKTILQMLRSDWKIQLLLWSMVLCIGLLLLTAVLLSRAL